MRLGVAVVLLYFKFKVFVILLLSVLPNSTQWRVFDELIFELHVRAH